MKFIDTSAIKELLDDPIEFKIRRNSALRLFELCNDDDKKKIFNVMKKQLERIMSMPGAELAKQFGEENVDELYESIERVLQSTDKIDFYASGKMKEVFSSAKPVYLPGSKKTKRTTISAIIVLLVLATALWYGVGMYFNGFSHYHIPIKYFTEKKSFIKLLTNAITGLIKTPTQRIIETFFQKHYEDNVINVLRENIGDILTPRGFKNVTFALHRSSVGQPLNKISDFSGNFSGLEIYTGNDNMPIIYLNGEYDFSNMTDDRVIQFFGPHIDGYYAKKDTGGILSDEIFNHYMLRIVGSGVGFTLVLIAFYKFFNDSSSTVNNPWVALLMWTMLFTLVVFCFLNLQSLLAVYMKISLIEGVKYLFDSLLKFFQDMTSNLFTQGVASKAGEQFLASVLSVGGSIALTSTTSSWAGIIGTAGVTTTGTALTTAGAIILPILAVAGVSSFWYASDTTGQAQEKMFNFLSPLIVSVVSSLISWIGNTLAKIVITFPASGMWNTLEPIQDLIDRAIQFVSDLFGRAWTFTRISEFLRKVLPKEKPLTNKQRIAYLRGEGDKPKSEAKLASALLRQTAGDIEAAAQLLAMRF